MKDLRIYFLPLMSPGHMIPMIDIAKLFAQRPFISITIITTPANAPLVSPSISSFPNIHLILLPFPPSVAHLLPNSHENLASFSHSHFPTFFAAFYALQKPLHDLILDHRPDCIVSDAMFTWTSDTAAALNIPRIAFYGHGIFPSCVHHSLERDVPYTKVSDDSEVFVVEGLAHRIEMMRAEVSPALFYTPPGMRESIEKSYGVIVNSFYELEPEYAEIYKKIRRAYYVGPVSLVNRNSKEAAERGGTSGELVAEWTSWLDQKEKGSVLYVCFGSLNEFSGEQLREVALGLEWSKRPFMWVVNSKVAAATTELDLLGGRLREQGLVIRGWVPQMIILNHPAVGAFVTHCGWNSILEGITAGVTMVTWPVEYEQFVNDKLIAEVLRIGVKVGKRGLVRGKEIVKAVEEVMRDGEEAEGRRRRRRVREYAAAAKVAVEEGGSSFVDLTRLIDEVKEHRDGLIKRNKPNGSDSS